MGHGFFQYHEPYGIDPCRNFFEIFKELLEVSKIDGWNDYFFLKIVHCHCSKALIAVMVFCTGGYWNSYMQPLLYLSDGNRYPLQLVLKNILISASRMHLAGATDRAELYKQTDVEICVVVVSSVPMITLSFYASISYKGL